MKNDSKISFFPEVVEKLEENEMLVIKGGNKVPVQVNNCKCTNNGVCW